MRLVPCLLVVLALAQPGFGQDKEEARAALEDTCPIVCAVSHCSMRCQPLSHALSAAREHLSDCPVPRT